ncbi:MAG: penicillin-binding transpeptidase domain-containing protein [Candidatus Aphodosoma sp.]
MLDDKYKDRSLVVGAVIALFVIIFIGRLAQLQLFGNYSEKAESNAFYRKTIYAPRGLIYDRNGKLLVYNQPTYDLMVTVKEVNSQSKHGTPVDTAQLCDLLGITRLEFDERIKNLKDRHRNPGYSPLTPQRFITQLSPEEYAVLQEHLRKFPGFSIQGRTLRNYTYPCAAHVLGSIGEVSQNTINADPTYKLGDYAGTDGMERSYERELRGENGVEILLRDARGKIQGSYKDGELDYEPTAGTNITSTLDISLQMLAEELLSGKIGSIVAIEPKTGEILALASSPTWNPSHLVGRLRSSYYPMLLNDPCKPLLNRATQGVYSPGSTFKTLQALVCLQEGGITEHTVFPCNGPASQPIKCTHHHGSPVSLEDAIKESCNPYFWAAYRSMLELNGYGENNKNFKAQYEKWRNDMIGFGLGPHFTDSDIPGLRHGAIPTQKTYNKWYGERGWKAQTIRSNSIGQGEVEVTPIQLANAVAVIANSGYYITPHVNKADSMLDHRHEAAIDTRHYAVVQRGMRKMYQDGSGRWYPVPGVEVCGKTGTTDNSHGRPHSIFIGYAPADDPQIAIAVVIENAGFGATWALPIASLCIEQYVNDSISSSRNALYERMKNTVLNDNVKKL